MGKRVAIVVGKLDQARMLRLFEGLSVPADIYAIENPRLLSSYKASLPLHVFSDVKDMPGYMRGLEEKIADADLLIGFETSSLATFQMVRIAKKYARPFVVIANEFHPYFYANYKNLRAIQTDILQSSDHFWATSRLAESLLQIEGVAKEKIKRLQISADGSRFQPSEKNRNRFREYIGIAPEANVLLFNDSLEAATRASEVLDTFRLLLTTNPSLKENVRLIMAGEGSLSQELKYKCYDLKLADHVSFLHQDSEPFLQDLYAASDILLAPRRQKSDLHETYPLHVLEAMACGVVPIAGTGTVTGELVGDVGETLPDDSYQYFVDCIEKLLTTPGSLASARDRVLASTANGNAVMGGAVEFIEELLAAQPERPADGGSILANDLDAATDLYDNGGSAEALVKVEELLLHPEFMGKGKSNALHLKGKILMQSGNLEDAMDAFTECVDVDRKNYKGYRGLGYLAFKGHSHEEAITFFKKALAEKEDDQDSLLGVGLVHRRLGLNEESLFWLEKCVNLEGSDTKAMSVLLQACMECLDPSYPIETLERLREARGDQKGLILTLGQLYIREGKTELGNELVKQALGDSEGASILKPSA